MHKGAWGPELRALRLWGKSPGCAQGCEHLGFRGLGFRGLGFRGLGFREL